MKIHDRGDATTELHARRTKPGDLFVTVFERSNGDVDACLWRTIGDNWIEYLGAHDIGVSDDPSEDDMTAWSDWCWFIELNRDEQAVMAALYALDEGECQKRLITMRDQFLSEMRGHYGTKALHQ